MDRPLRRKEIKYLVETVNYSDAIHFQFANVGNNADTGEQGGAGGTGGVGMGIADLASTAKVISYLNNGTQGVLLIGHGEFRGIKVKVDRRVLSDAYLNAFALLIDKYNVSGVGLVELSNWSNRYLIILLREAVAITKGMTNENRSASKKMERAYR